MCTISWPLRRAIAMYQAGETDIVALGRVVGMASAEIGRALRRRGYEIPHAKSGRKRHPEKWAQIAELYGKGMGVKRIGEAVGMHWGSVAYAVKTMANQEKRGFAEEVVRREKERRSEAAEAKYQRMVEMYQRGRSTNEVGEAFAVVPSTVVKVLQRREVKARSRSHANRIRGKREAKAREDLAERRKIDRMMQIVSRRKDWAA